LSCVERCRRTLGDVSPRHGQGEGVGELELGAAQGPLLNDGAQPLIPSEALCSRVLWSPSRSPSPSALPQGPHEPMTGGGCWRRSRREARVNLAAAAQGVGGGRGRRMHEFV